MRAVLRAILAFVLGAILTYIAVVVIGIGYMAIMDVPDRDGGTGLGIVMLLGPLCAVIGGMCAAIVAAFRMSRRAQVAATGEAPMQRQHSLLLILLIALLVAIVIYLVGWIVFGFPLTSLFF